MEPPLDGETKGYIHGPIHMTKMAATPIYGKNLQNLLDENKKQMPYDLETKHIASKTARFKYGRLCV